MNGHKELRLLLSGQVFKEFIGRAAVNFWTSICKRSKLEIVKLFRIPYVYIREFLSSHADKFSFKNISLHHRTQQRTFVQTYIYEFVLTNYIYNSFAQIQFDSLFYPLLVWVICIKLVTVTAGPCHPSKALWGKTII